MKCDVFINFVYFDKNRSDFYNINADIIRLFVEQRQFPYGTSPMDSPQCIAVSLPDFHPGKKQFPAPFPLLFLNRIV